MSYAWKRALRAIAVTSSTTAAAFLANVFSPMMPVQSFGIYAAIIIPANYLLIVLLFPPAVIIYEDHFEKFRWCGCCPCFKNDESQTTVIDLQNNSNNKLITEKQPSKLEIFFEGTWNSTV